MKTYFICLTFSIAFIIEQSYAQSFTEEQPIMGEGQSDVFELKDFDSENDGGVFAIYAVPDYQCTNILNPSVEIVNYGSNVLSAALIKYAVDSQSPQYLSWQGNLEPGETDVIEFNEIQVEAGPHQLIVSIIEANGLADINGNNNDGQVDFYIIGTSIPVPVEQVFEESGFPDGYFVENEDENGWKMYTQEMELGDNDHMLQMPFFYSNAGNVYNVYMKNLNLSDVGSADLSFDVAYRYYRNSGLTDFDELQVQASANCGSNWDVLYDKEKDSLATLLPSGAGIYYPLMENEWRTDMVNLDQYIGNANMMIRFVAISGHGNNLYLDNLKITSTVGIGEIMHNSTMQLYPNPANDFVTIRFLNNQSWHRSLLIYNSMGQEIYRLPVHGNEPITVTTSELPSGLYLLKSVVGKEIAPVSKLLVAH